MNRYLNSFIFLIFLILIFYVKDLFIPKTLLIIYTSILVLYLSIEIALARVMDKEYYLFNPAVLASFFTFILGFGITNYVYLSKDNFLTDLLFDRLGPEAYKYLSDGMPLVFTGAIGMWMGYHSGLSEHLYQFLTTSIIQVKKYLRKSYEINFNLVLFFIILSVLSRILAIYLGIFGYAQDPETIVELSAIGLPLNMVGELGKFCLLIISFAYFSSPRNKKYRITFIIILLAELFFGILSGLKSGLIFPFVTIFLTYYIINKRIKKTFILYALIATAVAYTIVEPFRILRWYDPNFKSTPGYIINTFTEAYSLSQKIGFAQSEFTENIFLSAIMRNNYIIEIAKAKEYNDRVGLQNDDPNFKSLLFTAPLLAYVPRLLWPGKPVQNIGQWYTRKVWGWDGESSTAMTPFGFLYFAGGVPFIVFFFFIIGIMQSSLFNFIKLSSAGGTIVYLGLISTVVLIDSSVNGIFISWMRLFPILLILQHFTFKR